MFWTNHHLRRFTVISSSVNAKRQCQTRKNESDERNKSRERWFFSLITGVASMGFTYLMATSGVANETADSPLGAWRTFSDDGKKALGIVRIGERNGELVGTILSSLVPGNDPAKVCGKCTGERKDKPVIGMEFLSGLKLGGKEYSGGEILDPDTGKIYRASLRLEKGGKKLVVRGYVGVSLFGRSQTWERVE
jgi:uncharacterized protein (DUF2147 family)